MNLMTITEISKNFNISTRTLRYYEQIGLLQSTKKDDYAYRTYDDATVLRLQQIVVLRKLRIPLKQIVTILESENASEIIETFRQNLNEVDDEITALSTIRTILNTFITRLNENMQLDIKVGLLDDISILDIVNSLTVTKIAFKDEKTMGDLSQASEKLNKLSDKDVRIIYCPPATVASARCVGGEPEHDTDIIMSKFVKDVELFKINPDTRLYGFNSPDHVDDNYIHGYEVWATIPDDLEVPEPLVKKTFTGGLYAAHTSKPINFDEWKLFYNWFFENEDWDYDKREPLGMDGALEEHFNSYNLYGLKNSKTAKLSHIDFLIPVKEKEVK